MRNPDGTTEDYDRFAELAALSTHVLATGDDVLKAMLAFARADKTVTLEHWDASDESTIEHMGIGIGADYSTHCTRKIAGQCYAIYLHGRGRTGQGWWAEAKAGEIIPFLKRVSKEKKL